MASVIYLTDTRYGQRAWHHPSARHRCFHYADALLAGAENSVVVPMEQVTASVLQDFDHAVFHRPVWSRRFSQALERCTAASVKLHADYDDLVFHSDFACHSPLYVSGGRSLSKISEQFDLTYKAAACFDQFLVSTSYLADKLLGIFPAARVTVLPNSLPRTFQAPGIRTQEKNDKQKIVGYFPGSRGHGEDLKTVIPALNESLGNDGALLIVGRMDPADYAGVNNVRHIPFAAYNDYLDLLSRVNVSIAPLVDNIFNRSKSAVKLIESVSVGTPIVSSENQDMTDHANVLSRIVSDPEGWTEALNEFLNNQVSAPEIGNEVQELTRRYSVNSRMPILNGHLHDSSQYCGNRFRE